ncbi:UPF0179 family protein [Methanimicrococcus blatticola]|uniref:UPF0179 protein C7391_0318 n=1 Tax=Methanimicrococcus blatticola TaxID=91560 RepID=A0A484F6Y4_9EURY|nr:UPF0179 family protein [Methanimicrococcus blatticola]MBZ3935151.1 UPF0179 family protein [Methanimicrococcus blatticola]MCC2508752.1 UPF0179 family protein [Methanimicrococcus blatticola]TDQ71213.1 hypothetical protein C7391_0318 [Methanimicrococcus blatticola]
MTAAAKITVIGSRLAKSGETFFFLGEREECKRCNIRGTCLNLDSGRKYEIVSVRNNNLLKCALHDGGVLAVEVTNAPVEAYIDSKKAIEGSKITFMPIKAEVEENEDGVNIELFSPRGLEKGDKCLVEEVFEGIERDGKTFKRVSLVLE